VIDLYVVVDKEVMKYFDSDDANPFRFASSIKQECHDYINDRLDCGEDSAEHLVVRVGRIPHRSLRVK
jgi:hypothetical protein